MKPNHTVLDPRAQIIQQNYVWDGNQWNGYASTFAVSERVLKNKASASHIDYLVEPGYTTNIMYQPGYAKVTKSLTKLVV